MKFICSGKQKCIDKANLGQYIARIESCGCMVGLPEKDWVLVAGGLRLNLSDAHSGAQRNGRNIYESPYKYTVGRR